MLGIALGVKYLWIVALEPLTPPCTAKIAQEFPNTAGLKTLCILRLLH